MYEIKKIKIWSSARTGGILGGLLMFVIPIIYALLAGFFGGFYFDIGDLSELLSLLIFPLAGIIGGLIVGALLAFFYNLIAPRLGGIEVEIVLKEEKSQNQP